MKVYLRDYLSSTADSKQVTSAFHYFNRENGSSGYMIGLITSSSNTQFEATNINRFVWNGIVDEFSSADEGSIERLKKTIASGKVKMLELLRNSEDMEDGVDLNITLVHFVGDTVYFGYFGNSEIHIFHDDELVDVSKVLKSSRVNVGSSLIGDDDVVLLCSNNFWEDNKIDTSKYKVFNSLLYDTERKKIKLGSGVVFASKGVDFEMMLAQEGPEIFDSNSAVLPTVIDLDEQSENVQEGLEVNIPEQAQEQEIDEEDLIEEETTVADESESPTEEVDQAEVKEDVEASKEKDEVTSPLEEVDDAFETVEYEESEFENSSFKSVDEKPAQPKDTSQEDPYDHRNYEDTSEQEAPSEKKPDEVNLEEADYPLYKKAYLKVASVLGLGWIYISRGAAKLNPRKENEYQSVPVSDKARNVKSYANRYLFNPYGRKSWYKKTRAKLSQSKITSPSMEGMKVGGYKERTLRKKRFMILGSLVLILIAGFFGVRKASDIRNQMQIHNQFTQFYSDVKKLTDQAEKSVGTDKEAAQLALFQAEKKLDEFGFEKEELSNDDRELYEEIEGAVLGVSDELDKVIVVNDDNGNFSLFFDSRIESTDKSAPTDITIYKDEKPVERLVVVDKGKKSVYLVSTYDQSVTPISDPEGLLKEPMYVDVGAAGIYVYDEVNGVLRAPFDGVKSKVGAFESLSGVNKSDFPFEDAEEFAVFTQNDNLYLLDSDSRALYKATKTATGSYGLPYMYYQNDVLAGGLDFFADFSTYVTGEGEKPFNRLIFDYVNNKLVNSPLEIVGVRGEIGTIPAGYTGGTLDEWLYLFDQDTRRIMAFEKPDESANRHIGEIHLRAQYEYRGDRKDVFGNVQDIAVDTEETRIFVLDGTRVWSLEVE